MSGATGDPRGGRCGLLGDAARSALPLWGGPGIPRRGGYEPEGASALELEPDGGVPVPAGGVPVWVPEPPPMLGQLWVEPEPELELELEPEPVEPDEVLDEPELVLDPVFPVLEPEDGVPVAVEEFVPEVLPELPVVPEVVAALATNAPPARRPEVSAPMASTLRRRICMTVLPFISYEAPTRSVRHCIRCSSDLGAAAEWNRCARTVT